MINNDYFKHFSDLQANLFRPMTRYGEIAARLTEDLTNNSVQVINKMLEEYQKGFRACSEVKEWKDFLAINTLLTDKATNELLGASQKCSQIMVEALSDLSKALQESYEKASAETIKGLKTTGEAGKGKG